MPEEETILSPASSSDNNDGLQESIDLRELADRVVALLLRELSIEVERTGR